MTKEEYRWLVGKYQWLMGMGVAIFCAIFAVAIGGGWWLRGEFDERFSRIEKRMNAIDTKIALLAREHSPATRELIGLVDQHQATLPANHEEAMMYLERLRVPGSAASRRRQNPITAMSR